MDSLPTFNRDGESVVERAKSGARNLLSWLPTPKRCEDCGTLCEASRAHSRQEAAFYPGGMVPSWYCDSCDQHYRREEPWHD